MEWGLRFVNQSLGSDEIKKKEKKKRKAALRTKQTQIPCNISPKNSVKPTFAPARVRALFISFNERYASTTVKY